MLDDAYATLAKAGEDAAKSLRAANDNAGKSFADMANTALNALSNLESAIKGGGILDILSSAFNAFGSIAGTGAFGKNLQTSFANFTAISGFRADGGPVSAGSTYVVGERGPELFTAKRSGYVHANGSEAPGRGRSRVEVVPSPYFDVVVDGRAAMVADPISRQNAAGAVNASNRRRDRRVARRMGR